MTDNITPDTLAELERLLAAGTPGPWEASRFFWKVGSARGLPDEWWVSVESDGDVLATMPEEATMSSANAALIVAAVNALPGLLATARAHERLTHALDDHHPNCYQNTSVPDDFPAAICDCRVLRMIDATRGADT